jgi:hypothetical protein
MPSKDELLSELQASRTDLARYVDAASRSDRPYIVVSAAAVRAWRERAPHAWAKVTDWLAAHGKAIVEV